MAIDSHCMHSPRRMHAVHELAPALCMAQAMARLAKRSAGFNTAKNLSAAADAKTRAKMQIAQALVKNQQMMNELGQSFESKLSESEKESAELLKSLGLAGISAEEMKTTPSLRNLNQVLAVLMHTCMPHTHTCGQITHLLRSLHPGDEPEEGRRPHPPPDPDPSPTSHHSLLTPHYSLLTLTLTLLQLH